MIDIRSKLHSLIGMLRDNRLIDAYELLIKMSDQEDAAYYNPTISFPIEGPHPSTQPFLVSFKRDFVQRYHWNDPEALKMGFQRMGVLIGDDVIGWFFDGEPPLPEGLSVTITDKDGKRRNAVQGVDFSLKQGEL